MGCINSKRDLSDINPNFYHVVNVDANGDSLWNGYLEISPKELILHRKGREPTKWSLQHLRRYGFESDIFTFEAGRRCPTGEGIFAFKCRRAEDLFHVMQNYIQGIALNDDLSHQLSDINLTSSGHNLGINGGVNSTVINRFSRQSTSNNSNQNQHNTNANYLTPANRQMSTISQNANGTNNFSNVNRSYPIESNYLEPTPMRNNVVQQRYSSGARLNSIGSAPISPEPNSPGSPNSFTIILEVTQLNQPQSHQNYANSNIYQEFPFKSSENNNNLLNNKLSLDMPPQEQAPSANQMVSNTIVSNSSSNDPKRQNNACSPIENDSSSRMYVNVTPGEIENVIRSTGTPTTATTSQMNFPFPRLSSTNSMDLSTRCYENLEPGEFCTQLATKQSRFSKPDIFAKVDLPLVGEQHSKSITSGERSEPTTPISKEENRKVNYIVLDLDNSPSSVASTTTTTGSNITVTSTSITKSTSSINNGLTSNNDATFCNNNNGSNQLKTMSSGNFLPLESPENSSLGYATIDFNKTVALSNSTIPSVELENEGIRKTRHSSTATRQSNSISD